MERANTLLQRLKSDLTSQKFEGLTSQYKPRLKLLTEKLSPVQHMGEMMSGNNFNFTVYLVNYNDQEDKSGLDEWRFVRAGGRVGGYEHTEQHQNRIVRGKRQRDVGISTIRK